VLQFSLLSEIALLAFSGEKSKIQKKVTYLQEMPYKGTH